MKNLSRRSFLLASLGVTSIGAMPVPAEAHPWVTLGKRSVRLVGDYDVIPVTFLKGDFRRIKLKVRENGIFINQLEVVYSTGGRDRIPIQYSIRSGGESRVIDLRGGDRNIRAIHLYYRSVRNSKGRSVVTVLGRR